MFVCHGSISKSPEKACYPNDFTVKSVPTILKLEMTNRFELVILNLELMP